jgi:SAM-dependent methyltransferase
MRIPDKSAISPLRACEGRCYEPDANHPLLSLIEGPPPGLALDCGCGNGVNARILKERGWSVVGITISPQEYQLALSACDRVYLADIEYELSELICEKFDLIIASHVIEHLRNPSTFLERARLRLKDTGRLCVALPNVTHITTRLRFVLGHFDYTATGMMDETHLRFYTFDSAVRLLSKSGFRVVRAQADGYVPLSFLYPFVPRLGRRWLNRLACRWFPNLFGFQSLYLCVPK